MEALTKNNIESKNILNNIVTVQKLTCRKVIVKETQQFVQNYLHLVSLYIHFNFDTSFEMSSCHV